MTSGRIRIGKQRQIYHALINSIALHADIEAAVRRMVPHTRHVILSSLRRVYMAHSSSLLYFSSALHTLLELW